jgi:putative transposase
MYTQYSVGYFCLLFGKSRQAYYEQLHSSERQQLSDAIALKLVEEIRKDLPRSGVPQLYRLLKEPMSAHGIKMGRDALYALLGRYGYLIRYRRRKPYTTDSDHPYRKYPNLIRDLLLTQAGQLWVSDITYLRLTHGFCYLSIITDAYSRKIVGYKLHPTLHSKGTSEALVMAAGQLKKHHTLIHHSDRGVQYCCTDYIGMLEHYNIRISMTENGDPYENAIAERINGILKEEFYLNKAFDSFAQAQMAVDQAIQKYNYIRPHSSCDYLTPVMAHEQKGILRKHWKNKRQSSVLQTT